MRTHVRTGTWILAVAALTGASGADDGAHSPQANGAATIDVAPIEPMGPPLPGDPLILTDEPMPAAEESPASHVAPAHEQRALGAANGPLNARPVDEAQNDATATWWSRFDPRTSEVARVALATVAVIGLLVALRAVVRRGAGGGAAPRPSGVVEILARYPVGRGQQLMLVKVARRVLVVHGAATSMRTLAEFSDPDEVAAILARLEAGTRGRGADRFRRLLQRFEFEHDTPRPASTDEGGNAVVDLTRGRRGRRALA